MTSIDLYSNSPFRIFESSFIDFTWRYFTDEETESQSTWSLIPGHAVSDGAESHNKLLRTCQVPAVTVRASAWWQCDASAPVHEEGTFRCCFPQRHHSEPDSSDFFSLLLNSSDGGVLNLGSMPGPGGLSICVHMCFSRMGSLASIFLSKRSATPIKSHCPRCCC